MYRDCFGREIKVGDVIASGRRVGTQGDIVVGIVTGFTEQSVRVRKIFQRDPWSDNDKLTYKNTNVYEPGNCLITGMSVSALEKAARGVRPFPTMAQHEQAMQAFAEEFCDA